MLNKKDFEKGKEVIYSDFGAKSYCKIKLIKITKTRGKHFWFDAEIVENDNLTNSHIREVGSIHSYSNSFIYEDVKELKDTGEKEQKESSLNALVLAVAMEEKRKNN